MFVINKEDRIDYVAAEPSKLDVELHKLFADIELLLEIDLSHEEVFYFGSYIHLVFVKIHPFKMEAEGLRDSLKSGFSFKNLEIRQRQFS